MITDHYSGAQIAFATMHGKDVLARESFRDILGADVFATPNLDTDQFGTFAGDIPRTLGPHSAARAKVLLGMQIADTPYGLASEGSFPASFGSVVEHVEILMFIDATRSLELLESSVSISPVPGGQNIYSTTQGLNFAHTANFPTQGVILTGGMSGELIHKSLANVDSLTQALSELLSTSEGPVTISPDYRAHRCPSRATVITSLSNSMARRLSTLCPACQTPGFGKVAVERGLKCADCGQATPVISADILGCGHCPHTQRQHRETRRVSAQWCNFCNP